MADGKVEIKVELDAAAAKSQAASLGKELGAAVSSGVNSAASEVAKGSENIGKNVKDNVVKGTSGTAEQLKAQLTGAMSQVGESLETIGGGYSKAVSLPIAAAATAAGYSAIKIDTALTGVRKTVDGTEQQYEALKDAAIEFSKTNAVDPAQVLDVQALGAQLGYTIDELDMFGEVVSGLDIATNMDADTAAMELAQFANIMQMSHGDTERYGSTIVDLGNKFATTESDVSRMAMRIAGAGKQIGMSESDVLGLATALSSLGIKAEAGGSAISTIMSGIDSAVATNSETLGTWAETAQMSVEDFSNAWKNDPVQALQAVLTGMDAAVASGGNMNVILGELGIEAIRQTDTLKRLAGGGDLLAKAVSTANTAWQENTALSKEVENRNNSLESQLTILWNRLQAVAIELGGPLVEALIGVLDGAMPIIDVLTDMAEAFQQLDSSNQAAILGALGFAAGFGPVTSILGKGVQSAQKTREAFSKLADGFKKVSEASIKMRQPLPQVGDGVKKVGDSSKRAKEQVADFGRAGKDSSKDLDRLKTSSKNAGTDIKKSGDAAKGSAASTKDLGIQSKVAATGVTATGTAAKAASVGMGIATTAANLLKTALMTIAPIAVISAIGAVVGAIGDMVGKQNEAAEQARDLEDANSRLAGALDTFSSSYEAAAGNMDVYKVSAENIVETTKSAIESQKELGNSINEAFTEVGTNAGLLDNYVATIEDLSGKSGLTAEEQVKLRNAVDGVNEILGTNYQLTKDSNDVLSVNTEQVKASSEAWKERAEAVALQQALSDVMAQQIKDEEALAVAKQKSDQIYSEFYEKVASDYPQASEGLIDKLTRERIASSDVGEEFQQLQEDMDGLNKSTETNAQVIENLIGRQAALGDAADTTVEKLSEFAASNDRLKTALEQTGIGADVFAQKASEIGISTQDLATILERDGAQGVEGFMDALMRSTETGGNELIEWCRNTGIEIPATMADGIEESAPEAQAATEEVTGTVEQAVANSEPAVHQAAYTVGSGAGSGVGEGMASNTDAVRLALESLGASLIEVAPIWSDTGEQVGTEYVTSMGTAIVDNQGNVTDATGALAAATDTPLQAIIDQFKQAGSDSGTGLYTNMNAAAPAVGDASSNLNRKARDPLSGLPAYGTAQGIGLGGNLASGESSTQGSVRSASSGVDSAARSPLAGLPAFGKTTGVNTVSNQASGMNSKKPSVTQAANAVGDETKKINKHSGSSRGWGDDLISGFAGGINGALGLVTGACNSAANIVKAILGHSVPKEGPLREGGKGEAVWGLHMVENFARGIREGAPEVAEASEEVARQAREAFDGVGADIADGIVVDFMDVDPMAQLSASIKSGVAVANMVVAAQSAPASNSYRQTVNFNQPVQSPDEIARAMRMQQRYGLAGRY